MKTVCPICDQAVDSLEACADCYNTHFAVSERPGHWTRTSPTEPGWYKVIRDGERQFYQVWDLGNVGLYFGNNIEKVPLEYAASHGITRWWSVPEMLPPMPGGGE